MSEINHILYENGVTEIFRLVVVSGQHAGSYDIMKPDKWDDIDSILDINDDFFNVDNFIIGDTEKIRILEYQDPKTFKLVKNVYEEFGSDAQVLLIKRIKN